MASSSMPPSLQVTLADGDMVDAEIFSDAGASHNDIDIDIDLSGTPYDDIDYMMDDTDAQQDIHQQPQVANDDNMVDEIEDIGTAEEVMVDEITVPEDDASIVSTLGTQNNPDAFFDEIDFDDDEQHAQNDTSGEPSTSENLADTTNQHGPTEQPTSTDETPGSDHNGDASHIATAAKDDASGSQPKDVDPTTTSSRRSPEKKSNEPVAPSPAKPSEIGTVPQPGSSALDNVTGYAPGNSHEEHEPDTNTHVAYDELTTEETYAGEAEDLRSAHYISTIVVDFNDDQFSLFPPLTGDPQLQQYESYYSLIDDTQLATKNLNELFATLRTALGDSVAVDEELEFQVHDLGLYISETCTDCLNFSFEMICDLFHRLNYNDGEQDAQPLFVSLIKKPRFSSRFLKLQEAADQGLGRSSINFLQNSEEEWDNEQHEEEQYDGDQKDKALAELETSGEHVTATLGDDSKEVNQTTEPQPDHDGESHGPENETQGETYPQEQDFGFEDHTWEDQTTEDSQSKQSHQAQLGSPVKVFEQAPSGETMTDYPEEGDDLFDFGEVGDGDLEGSSESHTLGNDEADRSYSDDKPTVQTGPSEIAQPHIADESPEDEHHDSNRLDHSDTQAADTEESHSVENQRDDLGRDDEAANNLDVAEFNDELEVQDQQWDDFQAGESWEIEDGESNSDHHPDASNAQEPDHRDDLGPSHDAGNHQGTNDPSQVHKEGVTDDDDFLIDWSDNEEETKPSAPQTSAEPLSESTPRKRSFNDFDSDIEDPIQDHTPPKRTRLDLAQKLDSSKSTTDPAR